MLPFFEIKKCELTLDLLLQSNLIVSLKEYVAVSRKNHSRKRFKLGAVKTAMAKTAGTNTIEYEVVYLEVIDPYDSTGATDVRTTLDIKTKNKLTVDSVEYESFDDVTKEGAGVSIFEIINSLGQVIHVIALGNDLEIITRNNGTVILDANGTIVVELQNGSEVISGTIATTTSDPFRWRPRFTPVKTDSDAVQISDAFNTKRYVSNVTNMRNNIKTVGLTERDFLPLWMTTAQSTSVQELGYVTAIPLCFCNPGESATIALNIANSEFNFRTLDFEIDRYIIDATTGNSYEQYIPFGNYAFNV